MIDIDTVTATCLTQLKQKAKDYGENATQSITYSNRKLSETIQTKSRELCRK